MKDTRILLATALLLAGTLGSSANQTIPLHIGYNYLTCQVSPGGNISDTSFLQVPAGFPSSPNDPPANHAAYYFWNGSGFNVYYYFNAPDATAWEGDVSPAGWYDLAGNPAPVTWTPGVGAIIYLPSLSTPLLFVGGTPTSASRSTAYPIGFDLRGSPTTPGVVDPTFIVSAAPANGDAIYVYKDPPANSTPFPFPTSAPQNFTFYYYDSFQSGWVPRTGAIAPYAPHIIPTYRSIWVTSLASAVIEGNVYMGANCSSTTPLQNWAVQTTGSAGTFYGITDANGHYAILVPPGSGYTVHSYAPPSGWTELCAPSGPGTVTAGSLNTHEDFHEAVPVILGKDAALDLMAFFPYPLRSPCCGQNITYVITYRNLGTMNIGAGQHIRLTYSLGTPFGLTPYTATPPGVVYTPGPGFADWKLPYMPIGFSGNIYFTVTLPSTPCPASISATALYSPLIIGDTHPADNSSTLSRAVTCSYDPNDMQVNPAGCGPQGYISAGQPLTYLIQFQNIGTGPAYQVVVSNLLIANLDISTFQVLGSSHPNVLQVQGNQLVWTFPNISLPAQSDDDLGSQGYVKYQVSPLNAAPVGAVITNNAAIYFDLNTPVITVTTTNTISASPEPVAAFSVTPAVGSVGHTNSFTYTGGSTGATYLWDFGPHATPSTSTDQNPSGIVFSSDGDNLIGLQVSLGDCPSAPAVQVVTAGVPLLNAQMVDGQLILSWQGAGYHLQETTDLQPAVAWSASSATTTQIESSYAATPNVDNVAKFYRLSQVAP